MDPFEEFEFKPLTEGLGFQNKKTEAQPVLQPIQPQRNIGQKTKNLDFVDHKSEQPELFSKTLPRSTVRNPEQQNITSVTKSAVDDILLNLQLQRSKETQDIKKHRADFKAQTNVEKWQTTSPAISPFFLDLMLMTATTLLCMILMLFTTRVDLLANISNPDTEGMVYLATAALIWAVSFIYMVLNRAFLGFTPGEWAYDMILGSPAQLSWKSYSLRVMARHTIFVLTGVFPLFLVSMILRKDLVGQWTGLQLHRKN